MKARVVTLVVVTLAAFAVGVLALASSPTQYTVDDQRSLITAALSDYEINADNSENVYQQQVVNGWVAKDLLTIQARQNVSILTAQTTSLELQSTTIALLRALVVMLFLLIVAVVIGITWRGSRGRPDTSQAQEQTAPTPAATDDHQPTASPSAEATA